MAGMYDEGLYVGRIVSQLTGTSKSGTPYVAITFDVHTALDNDLAESPSQGPHRTAYLYTSEKAVRYSQEKLALFGFHHADLERLGEGHAFYHELSGQAVLQCKHEEWPVDSGNIRDKWEIHAPLTRKWLAKSPPTKTAKPVKSEPRRIPMEEDAGDDFVPF